MNADQPAGRPDPVDANTDDAAHRPETAASGIGAAVDTPAAPTTSKTTEIDSVPEHTPQRVVEPVPSTRSFWTRIDRPFVFGFLLTLGGLAAVLLGLALSNIATVLIYIALALFAALGLDPAVRFLERRGISRAVSVVVVILALIVVLTLILLMIVPTVVDQITKFVTSVPGTITAFTASDLFASLQDQFGDQLESLVKDVQTFLTNPANIAAIGGGALKIGSSIATGISGVVIVLVLTLYFVATLPMIKQSLLRLVAARERENADIITTEITDSVGGYVMGMVTLAFFNAVMVFALYAILGLPFPLLMAVGAFLITLIPLVGSLLFLVVGGGIALISDPVSALIFAVVYLLYIQIEAYVLTPRVMNRAISIPGSLVVIGALVGGTLLGLLGALVAVPVTASILIIIKKVWIPRQDARV
jgi:predicted PurR-regulated permease PerM